MIDSLTNNPQPPENAADALILLHAFQSLSDKTSLHSPNAKRIQYFLAGEFVGKPSRVVVAGSYELARLSRVYGIADSVRKAADERKPPSRGHLERSVGSFGPSRSAYSSS